MAEFAIITSSASTRPVPRAVGSSCWQKTAWILLAFSSVTVFIPSSPTPFTGYTITVPRSDVVELPISVEEALRFAVTGGVLIPRHQVLDEAGGAEEVQYAVAPQQNAEQPVQPGDMVHMGVGDHNMPDIEQAAVRKGLKVAEVEQHRPLFEHELKIDSGIAERWVD